MPYTLKDAEREVGDSKDWSVGLEASIKKWEQRVAGDLTSYSISARCGVCFVADNRDIACARDATCLANSICKGGKFTIHTPEGILQALKDLRKEPKMDCSKVCANFEPKNKSPFPEGLKTEDLKVGMVVRKGSGQNRTIYTILEQPGGWWIKVLSALPGQRPSETKISLDGYGCQPYYNGVWNQWNWLREVK